MTELRDELAEWAIARREIEWRGDLLLFRAQQEMRFADILAALNDAVASDNFTVFHAKISKPFRDQFPPDKLRAIFKDLIEKHAVFDAVVASPVIAEEAAKIDEKGVLRLKGRFDTTPKKVKYRLGFIPSEGQWKLSGVTIDIE